MNHNITPRALYDAQHSRLGIYDAVVLADGPHGPAYWLTEWNDKLYVYDENDVLVSIDDGADLAADVAAWIATTRSAEVRRGNVDAAYVSRI